MSKKASRNSETSFTTRTRGKDRRGSRDQSKGSSSDDSDINDDEDYVPEETTETDARPTRATKKHGLRHNSLLVETKKDMKRKKTTDKGSNSNNDAREGATGHVDDSNDRVVPEKEKHLRTPAQAGHPPKFQICGTYAAEVLSVYDGDTITVVFNPFPDSVTWSKKYSFSVRVSGYDSAELHPPKDEPDRDAIVACAEAARDFVRNILPPGSSVVVECIPDAHDKYGRLLANVFYYLPETPASECSWVSLAATMLSLGHGYEYAGGKKHQHEFFVSRGRLLLSQKTACVAHTT